MSGRSIPAAVTPTVLKRAREIAGYSVNHIADKIDEPPEKIITWENGRDLPTISKLKQLSNIYKRPLAYFFLPEPPTEPSLPKDYRSLARQENYPITPETKLVIRKSRKYQKIATQLMKALGVEYPSLIKAKDTENPEEIASTIRTLIGVDINEQFHWSNSSEAYKIWRKIVENQKIIVLQFPIPIKQARGFTLLGSNVPAVVVSSKDTLNGKIFSLFHEFAHILLGDEGIYSIQELNERKEVFCNHFAGAFLVPKYELTETFSLKLPKYKSKDFDIYIEDVASRYKVSRYVILRRLETINIITKEQYNYKQAIWESEDKDKTVIQFGRSSYPERIISQKGNFYVSLVLKATRMGLINTSDAIEYLDEKAKYLSELENLITD